MNTKTSCKAGVQTPEKHRTFRCRGAEGRRRFATKSLLATLLWAVVLIPAAANCQTLDDAVEEQLRASGTTPCALLFASGGIPAAGSGLDSICSRSIPIPGDPGSQATGGSQGTATTRPSVVERRLEEARDGEGTEESEAGVELEYGKFGVFLSGEYENFDKDRTNFEDGYNSIIRRLIVGGDVQFTKQILAGLAFDTYNQDGRFDGPGNFEVDSYKFVAFGSFLPIGDLFVQVSANYGITSNERERAATFNEAGSTPSSFSGTPKADFDADQYGAFVTAGYDFSFGPVTLSPRAAYEWQRVAYETYRESGSSGLELKFDDFDITSSLSTLGLLGSIAISTRYGVLVPQASFDWKHQFDLDQQTLDISFVDDTQSVKFGYQNERPDRNYYEINAGLSFVMPNGFQAFGNYRTITSHSIFDSDAITLGLRYDF